MRAGIDNPFGVEDNSRSNDMESELEQETVTVKEDDTEEFVSE